MRRALSVTLFATAVLLAATPAAAQQPPARTGDGGQSLGLRYLTWPGRTTPARTTPERPAAVPERRVAASTPAPTRRPTPAIIPHGVPPEPPATAGSGPAVARGLTPANAWMTPAVSAPVPAASPSPMAQPPAAATSTIADPMAPRRDALIFRMQGASDTASATTHQPQPRTPAVAPARTPAAASTAGPAEQGARYYSVHRQNNRQPDPTPLPPATYVDAIAVDLPASLASQDLAAPPEPPTLMRNAQGRLQAIPDTSIPDQL